MAKTKAIRRKRPTSITILGRRWFQGLYGNTYHSLRLIVNGECVYGYDYEYGYGSMYAQNAGQYLKANGYLPGIEEYEPVSVYCRRVGIVYTDTVTDVARRRDLKW